MVPNVNPRSDEDLILACQGAKPEHKRRAVGILAERHFAGLTSYLTSIVHDRNIAEDLVQESFIRVYRKVDDYRPIARFSTWLYRIGRNLAFNEIRNRKKRPVLALNKPVTEEGTEVIALLPGTSASPIELLERQEHAECIRKMIMEIPDPYREVLVLCDLQKLSYQECADTLDIKLGTVRSRLSRARAHFLSKVRSVTALGQPSSESI